MVSTYEVSFCGESSLGERSRVSGDCLQVKLIHIVRKVFVGHDSTFRPPHQTRSLLTDKDFLGVKLWRACQI